MELNLETRRRLMELYERFPPLPVSTNDELEATQAEVDRLLSRERDEAEELYLHVLGALIYEYEERTEPTYDLTGIELVRERLAALERTQRDLVRAGVFATDSVASAVLAGKRSLTADQVRALAEYFRLPADLFLRRRRAA